MSTIDTIYTHNGHSNYGHNSNLTKRRMQAFAKAVMHFIKVGITKQRTRKVLSQLTDEQLKDIGKTRAEANIEAAKAFWE